MKSLKLLEEALENLRNDRKEIYFRIEALKKEKETYNQPQKELSIAKSIAKFFEVLQKINTQIIKISDQIEKTKEEEYIFENIGDEDIYSNIGDEIAVKDED